MGFRKLDTGFEGLHVIEPGVFPDARGYFLETYNKKGFEAIGLGHLNFVQDNLSKSSKGVLRGLHFQGPPFAQGKLVTVLEGEVLDVAVDIREGSATYGKHYSVLLSEENHRSFYVPEGFAHGFLVLSDTCIFSYKCTNFYNKASEGGLMWNDPSLDIDWKVDAPIISEKDSFYAPFKGFTSPFH